MDCKVKPLHKRLQNSLGPIISELRIDFACYENRYINNFSTKLTTNLYYYAARSFMKGSGASSRECAVR
ncbi:hypothetical protein PVAP13_3KG000700 [Panicum virgatum]|uniref:Uncharacterized protein n=1 Tax=Panicum virgatum TaxID=38727 RepID=A0A8T0UNS1_PANVG|nr:hypothetical protein PVAP13_8KG006601 [Panicum virgatum]KAG2622786.1 hypothetical protein PVAP13_3KG000700 [Panicum virgatum]